MSSPIKQTSYSSDNFTAYMNAMVQLLTVADGTQFIRAFTSELFGGEDCPVEVSNGSSHCKVIFQLQSGQEEPTSGAVYYCTGQFIDLGPNMGVRFSVLHFVKFPGDPEDPQFTEIAPPPTPACCVVVGRVVPQVEKTPENVRWRAFDLRSSYYNAQERKRSSFTTRWYIPDTKRWGNVRIPTIGTVLQISGKLLGRQSEKHVQEAFAPLAFEVLALDYLPGRAEQPTPSTPQNPASSPIQRSTWSRAWGGGSSRLPATARTPGGGPSGSVRKDGYSSPISPPRSKKRMREEVSPSPDPPTPSGTPLEASAITVSDQVQVRPSKMPRRSGRVISG